LLTRTFPLDEIKEAYAELEILSLHEKLDELREMKWA
jgi:hypothetical protein